MTHSNDEPDKSSSEHSLALSPVGQRRRDALLGELETTMRRRHKLQAAVRVALLLAVAFAGIWGLQGWLGTHPRVAPDGIARREALWPDPPDSRLIEVLVETRSRYDALDFGLVELPVSFSNLVVRNRPVGSDVFLDEPELSQLLGRIEAPIGLVRVAGRTYLASEFATDYGSSD